MSPSNVTTLRGGAELSLSDYADTIGRSFRTVQRWVAAGELPDARQDDDGRWWVPASAHRRRTTSRDVVGQQPAGGGAVEIPAPSSPLGMLGELDDAAAVLGTTVGGVRRLFADIAAHPGLPLYVGPYGRNGALRVFVPPRA